MERTGWNRHFRIRVVQSKGTQASTSLMRTKGRRQKREDGDGGAENDPQEVAGAREALQCAVEAVALAAEASENQEGDLGALYAE